MKQLLSKTALITSVFLALGICSEPAVADDSHTLDVVHFWVSKSESQALDVFRQAWRQSGKEWIDLPRANKVSVQKIVAERISNGYPPAVMQWNANEGSKELPAMGVVLDIDDVAQAGHWRDVLPMSVLKRITYDDKVYFAPTNIHAENWFWTSVKVFNKVGVSLPQTWDEIFVAAEKIKEQGLLPVAIGGGSWEISMVFNNMMYNKLGAEGYSRLIRGDASAVDDQRFLEALKMLRRISNYAEPLEVRKSKTWADASDAVGRGEAGMQFMGDWAKGELIARGYSVDKDFDCNLAPGTSIAYFMVIDAFAFPLTSRDGTIQAQREFAKLVLDKEKQVAFSRIKGSLPARMDVSPEGLDKCGRLGLKIMIEENRGVSAQSMAMPSQMSEGWNAVLADFFNDSTMSPETAQKRLHDILAQG